MKNGDAESYLISFTRADFKSALRKGMGRAALMLMQKPRDAALNAELLYACKHDLTYDRQCEETRATYLSTMIQMIGQAGAYREILETHLKNTTSTECLANTEQVFGILCRLAAQDSMGEAILRNFVFDTDRALGIIGIRELVRMQGVEALLACVHYFGPEFAAEPRLIISLKHALEDRDVIPAAAAVLQQARYDDVTLDRLLNLNEDDTVENEEPDSPIGYATLKTELERGERKYFPQAWIREASQAEIEHAAEDLIAEPNEVRVMAYLLMFRKRQFPGDPTCLFSLLGNVNRRVVHLAAGALAIVSHPAIREFALQLIAEGRPEVGARLLRNSSGAEDLVLFRALLDQNLSDDDTYHDIGLSALDLIKRAPERSEEGNTILLHLYENDPCSFCRGTAVRLLADAEAVPDWIANEGRYDAEPSIAERFRLPSMEDR